MKNILTILCTIISLTSFSRKFHVSPLGNDSNSGLTPNTAWKTISKVNSASYTSGDTIAFEGNQTFMGAVIAKRLNTVYTSYGLGQALISSGTLSGFTSSRLNGITLDNLKFEGINSPNKIDGVFIEKSSNITVKNVIAYNYGGNGIGIYAGRGPDQTNINVVSCTTYNNRFNGIHVTGAWPKHSLKNVNVLNCLAYNNPGGAITTNHSGSGIWLFCADQVLIKGCEAYGNGKGNLKTSGGPIGIWIADVNYGLITDCYSHHNFGGKNVDGGGFDIDGGSNYSIIEYCKSEFNQGCGYGLYEWGSDAGFTNNIIRNNTSYNDARSGHDGVFGFWAAANYKIVNCSIYNNKVYLSDKGFVMRFISGTFENVSVYNNEICVISPALLQNRSPLLGIRVFDNIFSCGILATTTSNIIPSSINIIKL